MEVIVSSFWLPGNCCVAVLFKRVTWAWSRPHEGFYSWFLPHGSFLLSYFLSQASGKPDTLRASQVALVVKNPAANEGDTREAGSIPRSGRSPKGTATHSRGSSRPRNQIRISCISCIGRWVLFHWHHMCVTGKSISMCLLSTSSRFMWPKKWIVNFIPFFI